MKTQLFLACVSLVNAVGGVMDPFGRDAKILIVGAGPAGVHVASRLKQRGYSKITLLERTQRVGGKSHTVYRDVDTFEECTQQNVNGKVDTEKCIAHEMGTCYLHNGYHSVRELVKEYKLTPEVAPHGRAMFSRYSPDQRTALNLGDYLSASILSTAKDVKFPWWAKSENLKVLYIFSEAISTYNELHHKILGKVEFTMPDRPTPYKLQMLNMTYREFLESNGLEAILGFLTLAHSAQGYGYVDTIPALYGLWWITPELLAGYLQTMLHSGLSINTDNVVVRKIIQSIVTKLVGENAGQVTNALSMLPEGYGKIWKTIYETDKLNVRFGVKIFKIDRQLRDEHAPVKVTYSENGGPKKTEEYDFLIYTPTFSRAGDLVKDLTNKEKEIFSSLESYVLATTLYTSNPVETYSTPGLQRPIMYITENMQNCSTDGSWYCDRNDPLIFGGKDKNDVQMRVSYQFFEHPCKADKVMCNVDRAPNPTFPTVNKVRDLFMKEMKAQRVENVTIHAQYPWPYFNHFPNEAIMKGLPWDLADMQGERKTWWLGSSASFESVHDVINYNNMILKRFISTGQTV